MRLTALIIDASLWPSSDLAEYYIVHLDIRLTIKPSVLIIWISETGALIKEIQMQCEFSTSMWKWFHGCRMICRSRANKEVFWLMKCALLWRASWLPTPMPLCWLCCQCSTRLATRQQKITAAPWKIGWGSPMAALGPFLGLPGVEFYF